MARKKLDAAPSLADMLGAPVTSKKSTPPQRNGEQERARALANPVPTTKIDPPPQVEAGHAGLDDARRKASEPARNEKARKIREERRAKAIDDQRQRAKSNPILQKGNTPEVQGLREDVRTTAHVLYRTGLATIEQIAEQCGVKPNTVYQWKHRFGWKRDESAQLPAPRTNRVAGHRMIAKEAKQAVKEARQQATIENVLRGTMENEANNLCQIEAMEPEGRVSIPQVVDFQGFDDVDCRDSGLLVVAGFMEKGLQGGSVAHEKSPSLAERGPADVTMPPLVSAVVATREESDRRKWETRRDDWRERSHSLLTRALEGFETLPDILLTDKDTTQALKHVQDMGRRNLGLDSDEGKATSGNLLVQILAAPVGVAVRVEQSAG